jgi:hypothetical protein
LLPPARLEFTRVEVPSSALNPRSSVPLFEMEGVMIFMSVSLLASMLASLVGLARSRRHREEVSRDV